MKLPVILHLETSAKNCSVSISKGKELLCLCEEVSKDFSHSKKLHTFITFALEGAEITIQDIDAIAVSKGPGSYTGLRIGVSSAKGLAYALQKPLLSTQTLRTMAVPFFKEEYDVLISCIDARRMEIFYQVFTKEDNNSEPKNAIVDEAFLEPFLSKKVLFIGNGSSKIQQFVEENFAEQKPNFSYQSEVIVSSQYAIEEALTKYQNQQFEDVAYFEPQYVKQVHTTVKKK